MKFTGEVATSNSDARPCYRVITQTLIAELNERDQSYEQSRLWELVDKLIEGAHHRRRQGGYVQVPQVLQLLLEEDSKHEAHRRAPKNSR
jgi:hypothetical protein